MLDLEIRITNHAKKRLKELVGLTKRCQKRYLEKVVTNGVVIQETEKKVYYDFNGKIYSFGCEAGSRILTLITVLLNAQEAIYKYPEMKKESFYKRGGKMFFKVNYAK